MRKKIYASIFLLSKFSNLSSNAGFLNYHQIPSNNQTTFINNQPISGIPLVQSTNNNSFNFSKNFEKFNVEQNLKYEPINQIKKIQENYNQTTHTELLNNMISNQNLNGINLLSYTEEQALREQERIDEQKKLLNQRLINIRNDLENINIRVNSNSTHTQKKLQKEELKSLKEDLRNANKKKKIYTSNQKLCYKLAGLKSYKKFKTIKKFFSKKKQKELKTNQKINKSDKESILNILSGYQGINLFVQPINYDMLPNQQKYYQQAIVRDQINLSNTEKFYNDYEKMTSKQKQQEKKFGNYNYKYFMFYLSGPAIQIRSNIIISDFTLNNLYNVICRYPKLSLLATYI